MITVKEMVHATVTPAFYEQQRNIVKKLLSNCFILKQHYESLQNKEEFAIDTRVVMFPNDQIMRRRNERPLEPIHESGKKKNLGADYKTRAKKNKEGRRSISDDYQTSSKGPLRRGESCKKSRKASGSHIKTISEQSASEKEYESMSSHSSDYVKKQVPG
jgi:hypothetical protein